MKRENIELRLITPVRTGPQTLGIKRRREVKRDNKQGHRNLAWTAIMLGVV